MNIFIDTHLDNIVVILFKDNKIIREKIIVGEKQNSKLIMPTIKEVLDGVKPESIIVCNGPGSFTGVRLGVTIAKTLAFTLDIPIRTITSLKCMALSLKDSDTKIVAFDDKNGYYVGIFDNDFNLVGSYEYLTKKEFEKYKEKYEVYTDVTTNYEKIFNYAMGKKTKNPHKVNPVYIKKLDVEK